MERNSETESIADTVIPESLNTSLGPLLFNKIVRVPVQKAKEPSEYENTETSDILNPELNLWRLGFTASKKIDRNNVTLPPKRSLCLELYKRVTNFTSTDCEINIDNEEFSCHLLVLQCFSKLFDTHVPFQKIQLPSDKCSASTFALIYEWMISESSLSKLNRENILEILIAAKYLEIPDLVAQVSVCIDNPEMFSEDTAFSLYMDAKNKNLPEVKNLMLPRIQKFFLELVSSRNWLDLDLEDVKNFLESNYICVNCEMEIFMAAVRWLKHDWDTRCEYKVPVMSCVRFGNISSWQLVDIIRNPDNSDFIDIVNDPSISKMIDDGLAYVIIKYWYAQDNEDYTQWSSILCLKSPSSRNWSGVDKIYYTYREFLVYLDQCRRSQILKNIIRRDEGPKSESTLGLSVSKVAL